MNLSMTPVTEERRKRAKKNQSIHVSVSIFLKSSAGALMVIVM
jgi:hypothetical protein